MTKITAKISKFSVAALRNSLRSLYDSILRDNEEELVEKIAKRTQELLEEFTRGWDGGRSFKEQEVATAPGTYLKKRAQRRKLYPDLSFEIIPQKISAGRWALLIKTDNDLFRWLDQGTGGMVVRGDKPMMIMTIEGHATEVGVPGVRAVQAGPWIPVKGKVRGTEARNWTKEIAEILSKEFDIDGFKVTVEATYGG